MKQIFKTLIICASSIFAISTASAAEPCKAYVKMDLGYVKTHNTRVSGMAYYLDSTTIKTQAFYNQPLYKDPRGLVVDAGAGYAFNDAMRAEILLTFKPKMKSSGYGLEINTRELGADARILYDFNNNTPVTPYVFGSLGVSSVKPKIKADLASQALATGAEKRVLYAIAPTNVVADSKAMTSISQKSKTAMTYGVGGGLSFKTSDVMNIDLTYAVAKKGNFVIANNVGIIDVDSSAVTKAAAGYQNAKFKKQVDQSLTIGFRFTM